MGPKRVHCIIRYFYRLGISYFCFFHCLSSFENISKFQKYNKSIAITGFVLFIRGKLGGDFLDYIGQMIQAALEFLIKQFELPTNCKKKSFIVEAEREDEKSE